MSLPLNQTNPQLNDLLLRGAVLLGLGAIVALRQLHDFPALLMGVDSPFDSCHG